MRNAKFLVANSAIVLLAACSTATGDDVAVTAQIAPQTAEADLRAPPALPSPLPPP